MKFAALALPVLVALFAAAPLAAQAEEPSNSMLSTSWSLEKAGKVPPRRQSGQSSGSHVQAARRDPAKPRVSGGARVTNQVKGNRGKARGQVGLAVPF
jgi:hypothetical protein